MKRNPLWIVLGVAGIYYACLLPFFPVGAFNDDALYILGARSLLQGHFVALQTPHHDLLTWIFPGYPLGLAPFVALFGTHLPVLKLTSVFLTLASVVCFWELLKGWADETWRLTAVCLFAFNPYLALYSGTVMSEPCFVCCSLCVGLLIRQLLTSEKRSIGLLCSFLLAWTALQRPEGFLLLPAAALGLAAARRWTSLGIVIAVAGTIDAAVIGFHYLGTSHSGNLTNFFNQYQSLPLATAYGRLLQHVLTLADIFVGDAFLGRDAAWPITLAGLFLIGRGAVRFSRQRALPDGLTIFLMAFALAYVGIHCLWMQVDPRYLLPVLGILILFSLEGLRGLPLRLRQAVVLVAAGCCLWQGGLFVRQAWAVDSSNAQRLSSETYQWIRGALPPEALILNARGSTTFLYTDRHTVSLPPMTDAEEFRYWVVKRGVSHLLFQPGSFILTERQQLWDRSLTWVVKSPQQFPLLYTNAKEQTFLFSVNPDPIFQQAFELYIAANLDFARSDRASGIQKLKQALKLAPYFELALQAYARATN